MRQIGAAVCDGHRAASENDANFVLSVIKAQKPRNETETMLAAHKAITNLGAMNAARLRKNATSLEELELVDGVYHKSTKSLLALSEGVKRLQSSGEPSVTVHQNVSVTDGGQAIVGNVTQNPSAAAAATVASPRAITDARIVPMPIIENQAPEVVVPFKPNSKK